MLAAVCELGGRRVRRTANVLAAHRIGRRGEGTSPGGIDCGGQGGEVRGGTSSRNPSLQHD